jgi:hypothetical protein
MKDIQYLAVKCLSKIKHDKLKETIIEWFRKQGITVGGVQIFAVILLHRNAI